MPASPNKKFFSTRAVSIGTFVGGPLAGGFMIGMNYSLLGERRSAQVAWVLSVLTTGLLFWGIFSIPDEIMQKVPNIVIPGI